MEYKDLSVNELERGYILDPITGIYSCIFCGQTFKDGVIYNSNGELSTAKKAVIEHIYSAHGGVFNGLINQKKNIHGLSENQCDILIGMYNELSNKDLSRKLGVTEATIRTHKFNIQKMKREAKILLALLHQIEDEDCVTARKQLSIQSAENENHISDINEPFIGNKLHPFFTQFDID